MYRLLFQIFRALLVFTILFVGLQPGQAVFLSGKTPYQIRVGDIESPYNVFAYFLMPNQKVPIQLVQPGFAGGLYQIHATAGFAERMAPHQWTWRAPSKPGMYPVHLIHINRPDTLTLNMFVLVPFGQVQNGKIGKYQIGKYPRNSSGRIVSPKGFIKVTSKTKNVLLSPHFMLGQFLCKQSSPYPKYIALREELILKLEMILQILHDNGHPYQSLHIMSGYRTPYYNRALGNVRFSQHLFGGAVDFFVDEHPKDNMMDDLNRDGENDIRDARYLLDLIKVLSHNDEYQGLEGGLAAYKKNAAHGPFVHTDVRGHAARWNHID